MQCLVASGSSDKVQDFMAFNGVIYVFFECYISLWLHFPWLGSRIVLLYSCFLQAFTRHWVWAVMEGRRGKSQRIVIVLGLLHLGSSTSSTSSTCTRGSSERGPFVQLSTTAELDKSSEQCSLSFTVWWPTQTSHSSRFSSFMLLLTLLLPCPSDLPLPHPIPPHPCQPSPGTHTRGLGQTVSPCPGAMWLLFPHLS